MLIMLIQCSMKVIIWADFKINQDYIAKTLCENKLKPKLKCKGNCQLMKALKKEAAQEKSTNNTLKDKIELLFINTNHNLFTLPLISFKLDYSSIHSFSNKSFFINSIFQPPISHSYHIS